MEQMVFEFFKQYGWQLTLIALSGIIILGVLKFFNVFKKVPEDKRKYVYAGISSGFSIIAGVVYLAVTHALNWAAFGVAAVAIYTLNQTLYSVYETYGLRTLLQKFGNVFINLVAKKQLKTAKNNLMAAEDIVNDTSVETEAADGVGATDTVSATKLEHNS